MGIVVLLTISVAHILDINLWCISEDSTTSEWMEPGFSTCPLKDKGTFYQLAVLHYPHQLHDCSV